MRNCALCFVAMDNPSKLLTIKIIHTLIWVFFNIVIIYLGYAVFTNQISIWVWMGIGSFLLEGIVLLIFKNNCPLTILARQYSNSTKDNFDIYIPNWLARHNKLIYSSLLILIIITLLYQLSFG